ncbi:hypothetical protein PRK78_000652 [Emydomyces testavorans]|uniref:Uncharacterized protein n=1 Tax=Emydomyces testavorans TaxID=2070801 RepID=A0AAF0DBH0_9EURO|nr:hypothetical protein PRK78_000652 [Emydomyces testavorans]
MQSNPPPFHSKSTSARPPATSRWCNRVLRPLTSAILRLERYWKMASIQPQELTYKISDNNPNASKSKQHRRRTSSCADAASDSETANNDPTWIPGNVGPKRIRHKYSSRSEKANGSVRARSTVVIRSPESEKLQPGEFTVATPLLLGRKRRFVGRDRRCTVASKTVGEQTNHAVSGAAPKSKSIYNGFPVDISAVDRDLYGDHSYILIVGGVLSALDAFLKITSIEQQAVHHVPSLLAISLKKTSEYILQEQNRLNNSEGTGEAVDVADFVFTEIENTYTSSNGGWKPLRKLVREHGIRLVCETIQKKWIPPRLARYFVLKSLEIPATDASETLLGALLSVIPAIPAPESLDSVFFSEPAFIGIGVLSGYMRKTGNLTVFFRELSQLLLRGIVPVEWMATISMKSYLIDAIQSIACEDEHYSASVKFLTALVHTSLGDIGSAEHLLGNSYWRVDERSTMDSKPSRIGLRLSQRNAIAQLAIVGDESMSEALNNTICSLLTVLCSAHITSFGCNPSTDSPMWHIITNSTIVTQRFQERERQSGKKHGSEDQRIRIGYILIAQYLLEHLEPPKGPLQSRLGYSSLLLDSIEQYIRLSSNREKLLVGFSALFFQLTRCLGRGRGGDGFEVLKSLTSLFESSNLKDYPAFLAVLAKVAVELALNFAEYTCLREHHAWATEVQEKVASLDSGALDYGIEPLTPSLCLTTTGFRWEDGIGEWVARTPCEKRNGSSGRGDFRQDHQRPQYIDEPGDEDSTTDENSGSGWERVSDAGSSTDGLESSVASNTSPPSLSRKRKFGVNECGPAVTSQASMTSGATSNDRMRQWKNRNHGMWDVYVDHRADGNARGTATRNQRALQVSKKANSRSIPKSVSVAIAVELPPAVPRKSKDFEIVVRTDNNFEGTSAATQTEGSDAETNGQGEDDDDLIVVDAPTFYRCLRNKRPRHSYPQVESRFSKYRPRFQGRRRSSARLRARGQHQSVVSCLNDEEISDDELSFL